uniref:Uncharacterized protein n=1 Tax=Anguilla anguilla TaxID=7936 RepID=A0A0E9XMI3_ANGAN
MALQHLLPQPYQCPQYILQTTLFRTTHFTSSSAVNQKPERCDSSEQQAVWAGFGGETAL